jgi:hypothetical protein
MSEIMLNELNNKISILTAEIYENIYDVIDNTEDSTSKDTFIVAGTLANLVGWYCGFLNEISPDFKMKFQNMIQERINQNSPLN